MILKRLTIGVCMKIGLKGTETRQVRCRPFAAIFNPRRRKKKNLWNLSICSIEAEANGQKLLSNNTKAELPKTLWEVRSSVVVRVLGDTGGDTLPRLLHCHSRP